MGQFDQHDEKNNYTDGTLMAERVGGTMYWRLSDHLGSTSLITNASGVTVSETHYLPYGQAYWQSGASQTDYGFTGQRMDGFGLLDYNARYYDPLLGRFISPDTIIPQPGSPLAWDRYAYVQNNPINQIDPNGNKPCFNGGEGSDSCGPDKYDDLEFRYFILSTYLWDPLPAVEEIKTGVNFPQKPDGVDWEEWTDNVKNKTTKFYGKYRERLFLSGYTSFITKNGMIKDQALISFVISGEFGLSKLTNPKEYDQHLGALSKQYAYNSYETFGSPICGGRCSSIKTQLEWLQAFHAIRVEKAFNAAFSPNLPPGDLRPRWSTFLVDATKVIEMPFGAYNSWGVDNNGNVILN